MLLKRSFHSCIKRYFDCVIAFFALILLAPLFAAVALAIAMESPGPIFFRQWRIGLSGRRFRIFKFRTMLQKQSTACDFTVAPDSRITRVGDFLRKSKIDELPQLINILLGEMSFVGPRPEVPEFANKYKERDRQLVFSVLPGVTDFASIRFRNENELLARQIDPLSYYEQVIMPMKLRYYRFYIARASLRLDIYIMALTVRCLIRDIVAHYSRKNHPASSAICSYGDDTPVNTRTKDPPTWTLGFHEPGNGACFGSKTD